MENLWTARNPPSLALCHLLLLRQKKKHANTQQLVKGFEGGLHLLCIIELDARLALTSYQDEIVVDCLTAVGCAIRRQSNLSSM